MTESPSPLSRRAVAIAGHVGDVAVARAGLAEDDPRVRATALGSLQRMGELDDATLSAALDDSDPIVRRRAAELAARHPDIDLLPALSDADTSVVEMACWACGEHESEQGRVVDALIEHATHAADALVREAAVAALGAIGSPRAVGTIIAATNDKPAVRRRAVLALAPFEGDDIEAAIDRALEDRDWQVRQAAEDLRRASR